MKAFPNRATTWIRQRLCHHPMTISLSRTCPMEALHLHRTTICASCHRRLSTDIIAIRPYPEIIDLPPHPVVYDPDHKYH